MAAAPRIGVLAYQGDVREHLAALEAAGATPVEVRTLADLDAVEQAWGERYGAFVQKFCPHEDGLAGQRVVERLRSVLTR